ncbi:protein PET100 homolog, mitochondrial-like [Phyllostomus discolor]|uniref:Protein PET100 homolog, mitochondrial-like n=1 Tax=Phyllostomus discolor TaxID=89673 RepID=A0A7E6CV24_9CHIR|nr:protein PET100 homolog, mitochondrial-like [Phyllostomus discolor]
MQVAQRSRMGVKSDMFQITLYLTFPVTMFWIANPAQWFEDLIQQKKELWPPEENQCQQLEDFKGKIRKQQEKLLAAAQQSY